MYQKKLPGYPEPPRFVSFPFYHSPFLFSMSSFSSLMLVHLRVTVNDSNNLSIEGLR